MAAIIGVHISRKPATATGQPRPGIRIQVIDGIQRPGVGMAGSMEAMEVAPSTVTAALATNASAATPARVGRETVAGARDNPGVPGVLRRCKAQIPPVAP